MSDDDNGRPRLRLIGPPTGDTTDSEGEPATGSSSPTPLPTPNSYPAGAWSTLHDLTGLVILLTGHGDGLDVAIATGLADYGARMAIAQRDIDRAKVTAQISSRPGSQGSIALGMDSTRAEHVRRGIGAVEQLTSQLDALVVIVDLGRASANREAASGVSLGEMIHLVRAAERRMAVLGGGRILIVAGGTPRDPAVGAITTGAVAEFVRTTAPAFATQNVTINGIIAALPDTALSAPAPLAPAALPAGPEPGTTAEDTVVDSLPQSSNPPHLQDVSADSAGEGASEESGEAMSVPSDEVIDQAPVLPFPSPADPPAEPQPTRHPAEPTRLDDPIVQTAPSVAAAVLFLSPMTTALTGQVVRIEAKPPTAG